MPRLLQDVVVKGASPRLLLVGINPGLRSGTVGHHFAGNGNPFWRLLHASGLTPRLIPYEEDQRLAELGIALTNLCPRTTRTAAELGRAEIARGRTALLAKIAAWRPAVVAFVGITLYDMVAGKSGGGAATGTTTAAARKAARGPGAKPDADAIEGARVFVVPNPSGLNASFPGFEHKLVWFKKLKDFVDQVTAAAAPAPADRARARPPGSRRSRAPSSRGRSSTTSAR